MVYIYEACTYVEQSKPLLNQDRALIQINAITIIYLLLLEN